MEATVRVALLYVGADAKSPSFVAIIAGARSAHVSWCVHSNPAFDPDVLQFLLCSVTSGLRGTSGWVAIRWATRFLEADFWLRNNFQLVGDPA